MAKDVANNINQTWLQIGIAHKNCLMQIRHWNNLKMAVDKDYIWVKDFTATQLSSSDLQSIPFAALFYVKDALLFPKGSLLPLHKIPALLWTPIAKALPVMMPDLNHNYFGIHQRIQPKLIASETEQDACALITTITILERYIYQSSAIRLQTLKWCMIEGERVLIYGKPMLPIEGISYWSQMDFLLPGGYRFELPLLAPAIHQKLNASGDKLIVFQLNKVPFIIPKESLKPLSIASFRLTQKI